jgi:hypothetical protein
MKKILLVIAAAAFFAAAGCGDKSQELATVNGRKITANDLQMEVENLPADYKMFAQSPEMRRRILDNLVVAELLVQSAEKDGIMEKPEIQQKIKETEMSIKAESEAKMEAIRLQKEKAQTIATREVIIKYFRENKDFKGIAITDKEIQESYNNYAAMMKQRDPKAKVDPLDKIKDEIKKSLAMQKTVEALKKAASININESAFPSEPPVSFNPQQQGAGAPGGVRIKEPAKGEKPVVKIK